eukprot:g4776.t1
MKESLTSLRGVKDTLRALEIKHFRLVCEFLVPKYNEYDVKLMTNLHPTDSSSSSSTSAPTTLYCANCAPLTIEICTAGGELCTRRKAADLVREARAVIGHASSRRKVTAMKSEQNALMEKLKATHTQRYGGWGYRRATPTYQFGIFIRAGDRTPPAELITMMSERFSQLREYAPKNADARAGNRLNRHAIAFQDYTLSGTGSIPSRMSLSLQNVAQY